jgi:uncharacterized membrane protein HdeD (DUF308 family)
MAEAIRFFLTNLPSFLFVAALVIPTVWRDGPPATRYLRWLLLLSVGVVSIWAGLFHVFFPAVAAARIGWEVSPFQFEIGIADLAAGIVAVIAFWREHAFRAAIAIYTILFDVGVAIGHVRQAVEANDYSPDNFGLLLAITVVQAVLLAFLLWKAQGERAEVMTLAPAR